MYKVWHCGNDLVNLASQTLQVDGASGGSQGNGFSRDLAHFSQRLVQTINGNVQELKELVG